MDDSTGHRARGISLGALALLAALSGCGRSTSTVSPIAERVGSTASVGGTATRSNAYESGQLVWWPIASTANREVEDEYGMTSVGPQGTGFVCALAPGQDPALIAQILAADPRVAWAEPNYIAETAESRGHAFAFDDGHENKSGYVDQLAADRVGLPSALTVARGRGIVIAVLDTGVDPEHPLLASHLLAGHDFVDGDADPRELPDGIDSDGDGMVDEALGHGSHVTGIVALVAPEAKILPLRVLDNDGRGDAYGIARAIDYACLRGARVINLSLGMLTEDRMMEEAIGRARTAGVVVVASAGNWGAESPEEFPAEDEYAMAIAASGPNNLPTTFTSFGSHIALSAPGEGIRSAFWNGHTAVWSGTSMSTPWVAGGAALLLSVHPDWFPDQVLARLARTAAPMAASVPEATANYGAGILDLAAALGPEVPGDGCPPDLGIRRPVTRP